MYQKVRSSATFSNIVATKSSAYMSSGRWYSSRIHAMASATGSSADRKSMIVAS